MVYFNQNFNADDEEKKKKAGNGTLDLSGAPNPVAPNNSQNQVNTPTSSGLFSNLNKFIDANKGKSEQFSSGIAKLTEDEVAGAKSKLTDEVNAFKNDVGSATYNGNNLISKINTDASQLTDDEIGMAKNLTKGDYTGKTDFISSEGFNALDNVKTKAQALDTSYGRALAQADYYDKNRVDARLGEQRFDNLLLNRDTSARDRLAGVKASVNDANTGLEAFKSSSVAPTSGWVNEARNNNRAVAEAIKSSANNQFNLSNNDINKAIEDKSAEYVRLAKEKAATLNKDFDKLDKVDGFSYQNGPDKVSVAGFDPRQSTWIAGQDFVKANKAAVADVITDSDKAKLRALSLIAGIDNPYASVGDKTAAYNFDETAYNSTLDKMKREYDNAVAARNKAISDVEAARLAAAERGKALDNKFTVGDESTVNKIGNITDGASNPNSVAGEIAEGIRIATTPVQDIPLGGPIQTPTAAQKIAESLAAMNRRAKEEAEKMSAKQAQREAGKAAAAASNVITPAVNSANSGAPIDDPISGYMNENFQKLANFVSKPSVKKIRI